MRKKFLSFLVIFCMIFSQTALLASAAKTYVVYSKGTIHFDMAFDTLSLINAERRSLGRGTLVMDKTLMSIAIQRAAEISVEFSHDRPDGRNCFDGFQYSGSAAENIAYGFGSAADVYKAWKNSEGHHNSFINGIYTRTGLGCMYINGTYYWAQVFDSSSDIQEFKKQSNYQATKTIPVTKELYNIYAPSDLPAITSITYDPNVNVTVKWNPSSNTTGYRIFRHNNATNKNQIVATVNAADLSDLRILDTGARGGWTVLYTIRPFKKTGDITAWGSDSKGKSAFLKPSTPNFLESSVTETTAYLKWTRNNCDGYRLLVLNPVTNKYKLVAVTDSSTNTYTVTGLEPDTEYTFYVRSFYLPVNTYIYSSYSPPIVIRTAPASSETAELPAQRSRFIDALPDDISDEAA